MVVGADAILDALQQSTNFINSRHTNMNFYEEVYALVRWTRPGKPSPSNPTHAAGSASVMCPKRPPRGERSAGLRIPEVVGLRKSSDCGSKSSHRAVQRACGRRRSRRSRPSSRTPASIPARRRDGEQLQPHSCGPGNGFEDPRRRDRAPEEREVAGEECDPMPTQTADVGNRQAPHVDLSYSSIIISVRLSLGG